MLADALERGVRVDVLSTDRSLDSLDKERLIRRGGRLNYFHAAAHVSDRKSIGAHAKFCIADGIQAYVGSANLTGPGLSSQVELGVLCRGPVVRQMVEFWEHSVDTGLFVLAD